MRSFPKDSCAFPAVPRGRWNWSSRLAAIVVGWAFMLLGPIASSSQAADLTLLNGKRLVGELIALTSAEVRLKTAHGEERAASADIQILDLQPIPANLAAGMNRIYQIELVDGSLLHALKFRIKGKTAEIDLWVGEGKPTPTVTIPASALFTIGRDAQDPKALQEWRNFVAKRGRRDVFVMRKGSGLDGAEGFFGPGDEAGETIEFELLSGKKIPVKISRLQGMIFNQPPIGVVKPTICRVYDTHRNILTAAELTLTDNRLRVVTVCGLTMEYALTTEVAKLDFTSGKLLYLSEADPIATEEENSLDRLARHTRDKNLDGDPIRIEGKEYPRGIGLLARTALAYELKGDFKEFKCIVGVDDSVENDTAARLIIDLDGRVIFNEVIRRRDRPKPLTIDVRNVKQLRIVVEADGIELGHQLILADAKLLK